MIGALFKAMFGTKDKQVPVRKMSKEQIKLYNKWREIDKKVEEAQEG